MSSLEAAEERWRLTIDNAPVGIALVGLDGAWMRVNAALCSMLGYTAEQLLRLTFQDITHPDDLEADLDLLAQLVAGRIPRYRMRKRYWHADGHEVPVDLSVAVVRNGAGQPMHLVSHIADLSDEMRAAARIEQMNAELTEQAVRLEASNADLEAFAMLVSHDLQTPLATVSGYLQLLEDEYAERLGAEAVGWIRRAEAAAGRMSELVSSLLTMSRSGSELQRVPVSIEELVVAVCSDLDPEMREHGATVEVVEEDLMIVGDPARLRQVLQNLLQNALKYRHPDRAPHVCVSVLPAQPPLGWTVTVDDNGVLIPADRREAVFGLFTQLEDSSRPAGGHGIGLAACRRIVHRHGGRIWVEENPTGPGNRFAFTLAR